MKKGLVSGCFALNRRKRALRVPFHPLTVSLGTGGNLRDS
jgi:hypothetical protein